MIVAYDQGLAERVRERLQGTDGVVELRMFGGWGITLHGNMAVGVMDRALIVRVGPDAFEAALTRPGVRPFDFTGRAMTGWVYVSGDAVANGRSLGAWVARGVKFAQSLPPKSSTKRSKPKSRATRAPNRR